MGARASSLLPQGLVDAERLQMLFARCVRLRSQFEVRRHRGTDAVEHAQVDQRQGRAGEPAAREIHGRQGEWRAAAATQLRRGRVGRALTNTAGRTSAPIAPLAAMLSAPPQARPGARADSRGFFASKSDDLSSPRGAGDLQAGPPTTCYPPSKCLKRLYNSRNSRVVGGD